MKKVNVKGPIVSNDDAWIYDWFGIEATSPTAISKSLVEANGEEIEVDINSGGGDIFAGSEIYTALKSYSGSVTTCIVGLAASAASVIAMAGTKVTMSPTAQMMIHNVSSRQGGDYRDMEHMAGVLKNANETIANAYRIKTGMEQGDLLKLMDKETWFTAQQALENKLVDEIMFESTQLLGSYNSGMLPQSVIEKVRNEIKNPFHSEPKATSQTDFLMQQKAAQAKLNLLKLKLT